VEKVAASGGVAVQDGSEWSERMARTEGIRFLREQAAFFALSDEAKVCGRERRAEVAEGFFG
jgi:hypothetical protein